jgi:hypothetical protein
VVGASAGVGDSSGATVPTAAAVPAEAAPAEVAAAEVAAAEVAAAEVATAEQAPAPSVDLAATAEPSPVAAPLDDGGEAQLRVALSQASREVIERIAWEVVPELAETIIREQLDRLVKSREQNR